MDKHIRFGDYIAAKRREREITSLQMAENLGLSPGYYCDIEKNRKQPPDKTILDKLVASLSLTNDDAHTFYDLAGKARSEAPPDLPEYINANQQVRVALRLAKDTANADDWNHFIGYLKNRQSKGGLGNAQT
jgi:transcriptional regulator with XRE-family HTH domain